MVIAEIDDKAAKQIDLDSVKEWLFLVRDNSTALSQIIHNMLQFSRVRFTFLFFSDFLTFQMQTSKVTLNLAPIKLEEFMLPFSKLMQTYPKSEDVELWIENKTFEKGVFADQVILQQILTNVISNSLKVSFSFPSRSVNQTINQ